MDMLQKRHLYKALSPICVSYAGMMVNRAIISSSFANSLEEFGVLLPWLWDLLG